jgi:hypothetical protein
VFRLRPRARGRCHRRSRSICLAASRSSSSQTTACCSSSICSSARRRKKRSPRTRPSYAR